jgi:hypothetical protein
MAFPSLTLRKTFTTSFSEEETLTAVQEMLTSKWKILFFSIPRYFGRVTAREFTFSTYSRYQTTLLVPAVKGKVSHDGQTLVDLKFQLPVIPALFLLLFPLMFVPTFFTIDQMTINGVLRIPTMNERIGWALFFIAVPSLIFYLNYARPLLKLKRVLKKNLRLEEQLNRYRV